MRIEIPMLPPKEYSLNARVHWAVRKRAGDAYKQAVYACCREVMPQDWQALESARMRLEFVVAEDRIRDEDNWRARFKPGQDALCAAGVIKHDDLKHLTCTGITFVVDKARAPLTIIQIEAQS